MARPKGGIPASRCIEEGFERPTQRAVEASPRGWQAAQVLAHHPHEEGARHEGAGASVQLVELDLA